MNLYEIEKELKKHVKKWNAKGKEHTRAAGYFTQAALSLRYGIQSAHQNAMDELEGDA